MSVRLQPGPTRDALAALSEHTRGGERLHPHALTTRTGMPYATAQDKLRRLAELGLAEAFGSGFPNVSYAITPQGQAMLDA